MKKGSTGKAASTKGGTPPFGGKGAKATAPKKTTGGNKSSAAKKAAGGGRISKGKGSY
jgi:hypothetical protein